MKIDLLPSLGALVLGLKICSATSSKVELDGLWTTVPLATEGSELCDEFYQENCFKTDNPPLHDALRVTGEQITCEHGGFYNMTELDCTFEQTKISIDLNNKVTLNDQVGLYIEDTIDCSWVSAAPGTYWSSGGAYPPPFTPQCSIVKFEDGSSIIKMKDIKNVHIVSMSHLDVGYTGDISDTINAYFVDFFPRAIAVQKEIEMIPDRDPAQNLHYITHPWIVYMYLHCDELTELSEDLANPLICPSQEALDEFRSAVEAKTITWHAAPMNMQVEWMNAPIFKLGMELCHSLDDEFGQPRKATMSQRDVPGMTRAVIPLLKAEGVSGVTVGVNGGVCAPFVPMLFRWQNGPESDDSIVAGWHPGGYPDQGGCMYGDEGVDPPCSEQVAGPLARKECMISGDTAFCFSFRTDNTGPPMDAQEMVAGFNVARTQFPGTTPSIFAGSLDDFFATADSNDRSGVDTLPVVSEEIGDNWINGIMSDVWKTTTARRMQTAYADFINAGNPIDQSLLTAGNFLLKLTEHTWGMASLYNASNDWTNSVLEEQLAAGDFDVNINDWEVQRDFMKFARDSLGSDHPLAAPWDAILNRPAPTKPDFTGFEKVEDNSNNKFTCGKANFNISETGALLLGGMTLGEIYYENLGEDVYSGQEKDDKSCSGVFGGKQGSKDYPGGETQQNFASLVEIYVSEDECDVWARTSVEGMGSPSDSYTRFIFEGDGGGMSVQYIALGKVRTRFNEAAWLNFKAAEEGGAENYWIMNKLGTEIGFEEVVQGGSRNQHASDYVSCGGDGCGGVKKILSVDTPLLSPIIGKKFDLPSVLLNDVQDLISKSDTHGVGFNLWNNAWNTNYMFFYPWNDVDSNISYDFELSF